MERRKRITTIKEEIKIKIIEEEEREILHKSDLEKDRQLAEEEGTEFNEEEFEKHFDEKYPKVHVSNYFSCIRYLKTKNMMLMRTTMKTKIISSNNPNISYLNLVLK